MHVQAHRVRQGQVGAAADLPQPGDPWLHYDPPGHVGSVVLGGLLRQRGPRPDDRHLAARDVDQLRELIQGVAAQPHARFGDPRVPAHLEQGTIAFVLLAEVGLQPWGVDDHGAELPHLEWLAVTADPDLLEEDGAAVFDADANRDRREDRRQQGQRDGGGRSVEQGLDDKLAAGPLRVLQVQQREPGNRPDSGPGLGDVENRGRDVDVGTRFLQFPSQFAHPGTTEFRAGENRDGVGLQCGHGARCLIDAADDRDAGDRREERGVPSEAGTHHGKTVAVPPAQL